MIGTSEYQLAKFLDSIIKNYIPDSYMLHSTDHFLDEINNFKFKADHKLVSFDVQSLFTNFLLNETITVISLQTTSTQKITRLKTIYLQ